VLQPLVHYDPDLPVDLVS